jgi:hypothetical protein
LKMCKKTRYREKFCCVICTCYKTVVILGVSVNNCNDFYPKYGARKKLSKFVPEVIQHVGSSRY